MRSVVLFVLLGLVAADIDINCTQDTPEVYPGSIATYESIPAGKTQQYGVTLGGSVGIHCPAKQQSKSNEIHWFMRLNKMKRVTDRLRGAASDAKPRFAFFPDSVDADLSEGMAYIRGSEHKYPKRGNDEDRVWVWPTKPECVNARTLRFHSKDKGRNLIIQNVIYTDTEIACVDTKHKKVYYMKINVIDCNTCKTMKNCPINRFDKQTCHVNDEDSFIARLNMTCAAGYAGWNCRKDSRWPFEIFPALTCFACGCVAFVFVFSTFRQLQISRVTLEDIGGVREKQGRPLWKIIANESSVRHVHPPANLMVGNQQYVPKEGRGTAFSKKNAADDEVTARGVNLLKEAVDEVNKIITPNTSQTAQSTNQPINLDETIKSAVGDAPEGKSAIRNKMVADIIFEQGTNKPPFRVPSESTQPTQPYFHVTPTPSGKIENSFDILHGKTESQKSLEPDDTQAETRIEGEFSHHKAHP